MVALKLGAGLNAMFQDNDPPAVDALLAALRSVHATLGAVERITVVEKFRRSPVYRVSIEADDGPPSSLVIKRLSPARGQLERLVVDYWLPAAGMGGIAPPLLASAAAADGSFTWHVYEDLGRDTLDIIDDEEALQAVLSTVARVHRTFVGHPLLGECRTHGTDYDGGFITSSVDDALLALAPVRRMRADIARPHAAAVERLAARLVDLAGRADERRLAWSKRGGPDTLLHGDLWTSNAIVRRRDDRFEVRLIDWDHAGVGSWTYDLSTLLLRLPTHRRQAVLDRYMDLAEVEPIRAADLNLLFEVAETARLANCVIWAALNVARFESDWAFRDLAAIDGWFADLTPVLTDAQ